jgi:hypothetical protein
VSIKVAYSNRMRIEASRCPTALAQRQTLPTIVGHNTNPIVIAATYTGTNMSSRRQKSDQWKSKTNMIKIIEAYGVPADIQVCIIDKHVCSLQIINIPVRWWLVSDKDVEHSCNGPTSTPHVAWYASIGILDQQTCNMTILSFTYIALHFTDLLTHPSLTTTPSERPSPVYNTTQSG